MAKTLGYAQAAGVIIAFHTREDPNDLEWQGFCDFTLKLPKSCDRYLIRTKGGGPNAKQRQQTNEVLKARGTPKTNVAVVTEVPIVRGTVTALSWFNPSIKAFSPDDMDGAMRYLGLSSAAAGEVSLALRKLQLEVER